MGRIKILFNWSSGKDSAVALQRLLQDDRYEISMLLTTVSERYRRISQHGVRIELLDKQARSLGLPLKKVWLPDDLDMERYGQIMNETLAGVREKGIRTAAFGDIFLEDLRNYREEKLMEAGYESLFPVWKSDTEMLARKFIRLGFRAIVVCVHSGYLDRSFVGRDYDANFLEALPDGVDPCGENGEFHTFVYDGPLFGKAIAVERGEVVYRDRKDYNSGFRDSPEAYRCSPDDKEPDQNGLWFIDLNSR